jgi:adenylate cyclase
MPRLAVGVGVATGSAYVGNVRGHDREIWSVIGNATNLAARLQALTRELGARIAVDAATQRAADYVCKDFVSRPGVAIRGRSAPVDVWFLPEGAGAT